MQNDDVKLHVEWGDEDSNIKPIGEQGWEPPEEARRLLSMILSRVTWDQSMEAQDSGEGSWWEDIPQVARDFIGGICDDVLQVGEMGSFDVMASGDGADVSFREKEEPGPDDPAPSV